MNRITKTLKTFIFAIVLGLFSAGITFAAEPMFTVTPSSGYVTVGKTYTIDIKIDSAGEKLTLARAVFVFNPLMVKIVKAEKNASIFCTWPEDQQTIDNKNGVVMVTAFCQSGADDLYLTEGGADVFTRITFTPLKAGSIVMNWEWTGEDQEFKSVMMIDGSPTENVLLNSPLDFKYTAVTTSDGGGNNGGGTTPNTGVLDMQPYVVSSIILVSIALIFGGSYLLLLANKKLLHKKFKTLVVYEERD
jgi:hypothetical protein